MTVTMMEKSDSAQIETTATPGPDWNLDRIGSSERGTGAGLKRIRQITADRWRDLQISSANGLNRFLPKGKQYTPLKLRRRSLLLLLLLLCLLGLALIVGLAVGLSARSKHSSANPLLPSGSTVYHGDLTYYNPGLGACGVNSSDNDEIVAVSHILWDSQAIGSNPNTNPLCGRTIRAQRFDSRVGQDVSVDLKVVDRCVGCQSFDLDVSPTAFDQLADPVLGRVHDLSWTWI